MLVGRAPELAALAARLAEGKSLYLIGEAGVGKTSLLRAAAGESERRIYEGGGLSSLAYLSYLPLVRALREEPPAGDHAAVAAWVAERVDDGLVVLDDLHWADSETLSLLPLLAPRVALLASIRTGDPGAARAAGSADAAGLESLRIEGLSDSDAEALVRASRPELDHGAIAQVVAQAGGNPLLLEELAAGDGSETLRLAMGARLRRCSRTAQKAMALLGLLGRPADRSLIAEGAHELLAAALVRETDEGLAPRHALLGETATERLSDQERRKLHGRLAGLLDDPGEAARHHQAAGEVEAAHGKALAAAEASARPGERARHLGLAAFCASGPEADALRLKAANALVEVGDFDAVEDLTAAVESQAADVRAEVHLTRARMHFGAGDVELAEAEIQVGLALAAGTGWPTEVRLRIERIRAPLGAWETARAVELGEEALAFARAAGVDEALALTLAGTAHYDAYSPASREYHEAALRIARQAGDVEMELEAAQHLLLDLFVVDGDGKRAYALSQEMAERARSLGLRRRELEFGTHVARMAFYVGGDAAAAIAGLSRVMDEPALGSVRDQIVFDLLYPLAWTGRIAEARSAAEKALPGRTVYARAALAVGQAELEWHAGRSGQAFALAKECLASVPSTGPTYEAAQTLAWAALDLGRPRPDVGLEPVSGTLVECALAEVDALDAFAAGRFAEAELLLESLAARWSSFILPHELRCLWAAGEAARRGDALEHARERLLAVEERAERHGFAPLLGRIRRSLRLAGVPRVIPRSSPPGGLTGREREILALVGEGLSTKEAARRLGISGATVETQLKSARRKLGARTRAQAAALARTEH